MENPMPFITIPETINSCPIVCLSQTAFSALAEI
jgi:hypothetical protein